MPNSENQPRDILSVSRLVREVRAVLENSFPLLWVEGELSNLATPASGHIYFSLKDEVAQVRCAMFRMKRMQLRFRPQNGQQVLIRARVSLYEARGEFQLIAEHMEPAGEGALRLAFEQLKARLDAEGLFAAEHKLPVPTLPRQIGLITSPSGAAIRDLLTVLRRRFPALPVVVYPVPVQGAEAPAAIIRMLQIANQRRECDVLILARGGGSLEDLQAFNEEAVARAIFASRIPLVTGIGHEIDFTIADFVADLRAPTPSAAAEHVTPDQVEWLQRLGRLSQRLSARIDRQLRLLLDKLIDVQGRLLRQHPQQRLQQRSQRLDELSQRLILARQYQMLRLNNRLATLRSRLDAFAPQRRLLEMRHLTGSLTDRLQRQMAQTIESRRNRFGQLARDLQNLSPLSTLERGYAIVSRVEDGGILRDAEQTRVGEKTRVRLAKGTLLCVVQEVHKG